MRTKEECNIMSYDELCNAIENDSTENKFKTAAEYLLSAVTDWPTFNLQEPKDLIIELKNEIEMELTYDNLDSYLKKLEPCNDGWKMEALSAVLELFDFDRNRRFDKSIDLEIVVDKLTQHYRQK